MDKRRGLTRVGILVVVGVVTFIVHIVLSRLKTIHFTHFVRSVAATRLN